MKDLYPEIRPYRTQQLKVDDVHTLYLEEVGDPDGLPAVFLHGGPGGTISAAHRRLFDPKLYDVILFDQRGAGRSTPHAELSQNTTQDLIADIEKIREHLDIERWLVFGGSWGSTLALAYAQACPERVRALVMRGIFLCRPHEIAWFYQQGASRLFPDYWQDFISPVDPSERDDILGAYHRMLTGKDELRRLAAAKAWSVWEGRTATLLPDERVASHFAQPHVALSLARIECHYFVNDAFLRSNQLLQDAPRLDGIPGLIVHGRYDAICPLENAWELHHAWSGSELSIVADAGHAATEPGIRGRLVEALDYYADEGV
jgi:proline iminopeptidase